MTTRDQLIIQRRMEQGDLYVAPIWDVHDHFEQTRRLVVYRYLWEEQWG